MRRKTRERLAWALAATATGVAIAFGVGYALRAPHPPEVVRFSVETPLNASLFPFDERGIALSPDGSRLAFVAASEDGRRLIYLRPLSSDVSQAVTGTEDASYPFWSPDGQSIGFFAAGKLKKISSGGGPAQVICDAASGRGGTWNDSGDIIFAPTITSPLFRVSSAGGTPVQVTFQGPDSERHRWPWFLPDGKRFLFTGNRDLHLGTIESRETRTLIEDASNGQFVPPDRLLFSRGEVLMMQKLDLRTVTLKGEPVPLPFGSVSHWAPKRLTIFSAAHNGTLAYLPAAAVASRIVWIDRSGREVGSVGEVGRYGDVALSPDGKKIAVVKGDFNDSDIWLFDVADARWSRFTFHPGQYGGLAWSADGSTLAFMYAPEGIGQLFTKPLSRDADASQVVKTNEWCVPYSFSPDGRLLLFARQMPATSYDLYSVTLDGKAALKPIVQTPFAELRGDFSPDGKWFAYDSNESNRTEVYVRRFPPTADQWQVSANGGVSPLWRADGRELYYFGSEGVVAVPMNGGERLNPGTPVQLFHSPNQLYTSSLSGGGTSGRVISGVTADGQRFLIHSNAREGAVSINVVLNWMSATPAQRK